MCESIENLLERLAEIALPSLDQLNLTSGAPLALHMSFAVSPTLAAAFASTGERSMSGLSANQN